MFLPLTKQELRERGWDRPDFICVTGDAYVDHPSFGIAIVSRLLESLGYRVAMIAQPVSDADYLRFGAPKYGWWVTGGNIDSMVAHYTAAKRKRSDDAYTPAGRRAAAPTAPQPSTATGSAPSSPTRRSSSAGWRRRCAASPTTTTGRTR